MVKYKDKLRFLTPSFIIILILGVIFYFEGLYPFGDYSIVQVDADYQYIPVMFRIWDFLHGDFNILYDDIGFGNNIYISMIIQGSLFSPINLLLYFTSRSNILNFFNIFVIVKIALLALTTYIFINYKFKVKEYYKILFSVLYALSGWVMLNYFNIMWLDSVILFPLIVMFTDKLMLEKKVLGYIITLALSLMISYYISLFILIFILFYTFLNLFLFSEKENSKKIIFYLGLSTLIAILLSGISLFPALYQTLISSRLDGESKANLFDCFLNKSLYLMGSTLFIVLFIKLILKFKKEEKKIFFLCVLLLLFIIGLFMEPINLALHMGSHWSFPYRYSFITIFVLMIGSLFYLKRFNINGNNSWYWIFTFIIILGFGIYFNSQYLSEIIDSQIVLDFDEQDVYNYILVIFFISLILYYLSISFKNRYLRYLSISISSLFIIFVYASWTMYYSDGYFLTKNSISINESLDLPKDGRYKMDYTVYTPSYAFIYNVPTLDNWLHILPNNEVDLYEALGYETSDTCIRSYGGTVFSDWLLNFKYIISKNRLNDEIYRLLDQNDEYYLYQYNYQSGFGIEFDNFEDIVIDNINPFDLQNHISNNLFGKDIVKIDNYSVENANDYNISLKVKEKGFLYFYNENDKNIIDYIKINNNYIFYYEKYIKYLGIYDEDINIYISFKENTYTDLNIGFIKYKDIINLNNENEFDGNYLEVDSDGGKMVLPINNIPGLKIYNNGQEVESEKLLNNFLVVELNEGKNKLEIEYDMPLFKLGIISIFLGIVILIFYKFIPINNIVCNIVYYGYFILNLGLLFYFYVYSFLKYMI